MKYQHKMWPRTREWVIREIFIFVNTGYREFRNPVKFGTMSLWTIKSLSEFKLTHIKCFVNFSENSVHVCIGERENLPVIQYVFLCTRYKCFGQIYLFIGSQFKFLTFQCTCGILLSYNVISVNYYNVYMCSVLMF